MKSLNSGSTGTTINCGDVKGKDEVVGRNMTWDEARFMQGNETARSVSTMTTSNMLDQERAG
jgi:hypothetical protein